MIVTEQEAKTKVCQETMQPVGTMAAVYREPHNCIGSACMAWRWWIMSHSREVDRTTADDRAVGFCGKAGKP